MAVALLAYLPVIAAAAAPDPVMLVRTAVTRGRAAESKARDWTYRQELIDRDLDKQGNVASQESTTREILILYGRYVSRVVARNGKPLEGRDAEQERKRIEKLTGDWSREDARHRENELKRAAERERRETEFLDEIPRAYDFRLAGEESVEGRPAWIVEATPRRDFKPTVSRGDILSKFKGRMWIDAQELRLARIDCETIDTVSFGFFIARFGKGAHIRLDLTRVEPDVWLPRHTNSRLDARLALVKRFRKEIEQFNSDFRKFTASSNIAVSR